MRRFILWIAAILITFAIGVGADRLWWHFFAVSPVQAKVEPVAIDIPQPQSEVVFVPAPPPPAPRPPKPNLILDYDSERFSLWSVFYVMGPTPKEFSDFNSMEVMLTPESRDDRGAIFYVKENVGDYDRIPATFALVTEQRLFFTTSGRRDAEIEYRFEGEFLRHDFDSVAGKNKAVLRGTLTKMQNGRTIAQREFNFRMEFMGC